MAGDKVLRSITAVLQDTLGERALLGRYGGEEFSVLLPGAGQEEALVLAEHLRQAAAMEKLLLERETVVSPISLSCPLVGQL